jgi:hypothetical protein
MKFLCSKSFEHSGIRSYTKGSVYDFTSETAAELAALDKKRSLGALEYFTPVDDTASAFIKAMEPPTETGDGTGKEPPTEDEDGTGKEPGKKKPTKAELTAEAQGLGIVLTGSEKATDIAALIDAKKAAASEAGNGSTPSGDGAEEKAAQ